MGENSKIEWCDDTVNFWIGCAKVSPGCDHCYAERDWGENGRFNRATWGNRDGSRDVTKAPVIQLRRIAAKAKREGRRRRVFINSLSDWADNHKSITSGLRGNIFEAAKLYPEIDLLLLTKRPQNMARYLPDDWDEGYPNVWLGVTVENQTEAARRVPILEATPAAKRFLSCEPLINQVNLTGMTKIDWVIVGGESGPKARPMHPDWARDIRDQCADAQVPFFFKQWGEWSCDPAGRERLVCSCGWSAPWGNKHEKCVHFGNMVVMGRVGKKTAGATLDGQTWNEVPPERASN